MRGHPRPDRFVLGILDTELLAGGLDHMRHAWVVDVTDSGEQVVLDLEIQPPEKPRGYAALAGEVHRRLHLMHRPTVVDTARSWAWHRKRRGLHGVGQLAHDGHHNPEHG